MTLQTLTSTVDRRPSQAGPSAEPRHARHDDRHDGRPPGGQTTATRPYDRPGRTRRARRAHSDNGHRHCWPVGPMCYFEQTLWACGYWKWGNFRQQCPKEYRTGETCGLKLVYNTVYLQERCRLCEQIDKKQRRLEKLKKDVDRWRREGDRPATVEKTEKDMCDIHDRIVKLSEDHSQRQINMT